VDDLTKKHCVPCEGGVPRLSGDDLARYTAAVPGWKVDDAQKKIHRRHVFDDFVVAMQFINRMADIAEAEAHHPDFTVHYSVVDVTLWTHAIGGLSENDFILAAKIDAIDVPRATV
jgi:4a-hydroxytetrahydrobiopterin dehydratase